MPWILPSGKYYDSGNVVAASSIEVDVRPSALHDYVSGGVGNTVWAINPQREAEALQKLADQAAINTAKVNANLTLLISATPAQISTFCTNKFPTLTAPERAVIADILLAVQVVAKGVLR